jgi:superfamily II DNA or RNA helicase
MEIRPHQFEALQRFDDYYYNDGNVRGILSMCCGSGKTFTVYNMMKHCINVHGENLFIFATSRVNLIKQVTEDFLNWFANDNIDCMFFLKVSENYVFKKSNGEKFDNYDYLKKRIADDVRLKLFTDKKIVIIITTYHGSKDIVSSFHDYNKTTRLNLLVPDLVILDEAHNTAGAGENEIKISQSLIVQHDENTLFSPQKILFVTATPLKIIKQNSSSTYLNDDTIYSMDNEVIYGDVIYEYPFKNGIHDGFIVDWDTIMLKRNNYEDEVNGLDIDSIKKRLRDHDKETINIIHFYISALLLIKIIRRYNIHNIIVYLSDVNQVKVFHECLNMVKDSYIEIYSVHDKNTPSLNKRNRENFENKNKIIDTNICKILLSVSMFDEGVDIKECDCVMFAMPRSAETTIVQNIGRALRPYEATDIYGNKYIKGIAYVIIPCTIFAIEDSEESVYSSKYNKIRQISDKMREDAEENIMYKRKVKLRDEFTNPTCDESIEEMSSLIDKKIVIDNVNNKTIKENIETTVSNLLTDDVKKDADGILNLIGLTSGNNNVSNIALDKIRQLARANNIETLPKLGELLQCKGIFSIPHEHYKGEFICYKELLFGNDKVLDFEQAKNIIKNELDLSKITEPKEWMAYCTNVFNNALNGIITNERELDILMRIPFNPKDYYIGEWDKDNNSKGWNDFLGKELKNTTGIEVKSDYVPIGSNAFKNLSNLFNDEHIKINKYKALQWQTYDTRYNLDILKDYLLSEFGICCDLEIRVQLTKKLLLDRFIINVHIPNMEYTFVPIIIYPDCSILYDKSIYDKQMFHKRTQATRTEKKYICESSKQDLINNLNIEIKEFFKKLS